MASIVPGRRNLRTTRTTARDIENAHPNRDPPRASSRVKSLTSNATVSIAAGSKAKATLSGDVKADQPAVKRKREALAEVTALTRNQDRNASKGKQKEAPQKFDGVVINKAKISTRQPLKRIGGTRPDNNNAQAVDSVDALLALHDVPKLEAPDEDAMVVDQPAPNILPGITIRQLQLPENLAPKPRPSSSRRTSTRSVRGPSQVVEEDPEAARVFKKRRTSSEAPEEHQDFTEDVILQEHDAILARVSKEVENFVSEPEADPEGDQWQDLDADDADDHLMVSEYVVEVFEYLKQLEVTTIPNPNYMAHQKELSWDMRGILTDWLVQVHQSFRLLPETLFLCVNIIDRFMSARVVSLVRLQLVGVTCLSIAAKFEEVEAPEFKDYLESTEGSYNREDMTKAERYVLKTLDYNLSFPNPVNFLRRISKADEYNVRVRTLAKYLLEIGCVEWRLIAAPPSLLAAAAMWLSRLMLGMDHWNANLAHYSSYPESSILPTANLMVNYILKPLKHEAFFKKYAHKKYAKVSVYARDWATEKWPVGTYVELARDLPALKKEIRAAQIEDRIRTQHEKSLAAHTRASRDQMRAR